MSTRLQVVMTDEELDEVRRAAEQARLTVSEWVRLVLRGARKRSSSEPPGAPGAVREAHGPYGDPAAPVGARVHVEMELNGDLLEAVRRRYHQPNWRAAVEYALRRAAVTPMTREEALDMRGVGWEGDVDAQRSGDAGGVW